MHLQYIEGWELGHSDNIFDDYIMGLWHSDNMFYCDLEHSEDTFNEFNCDLGQDLGYSNIPNLYTFVQPRRIKFIHQPLNNMDRLDLNCKCL